MVSLIGGGNRSTLRKPPTCHKSLTNFITICLNNYSITGADPGGAHPAHAPLN